MDNLIRVKGCKEPHILYGARTGINIKKVEQFCGQDTVGLLLLIEKDIRQNYMEDISLKSLSEKYYISRPYLGQLFRKQFSVSFKDYLNSVRLENAEKLLLQTDEKVYNIASMVGYNNSDYFINKFTGAKGVTPARFRRLEQNKREDSKKCKVVSNE